LRVIRALPPEHVLLTFFGSEPELLDVGAPWFYNQLTFIVDRERDRLTCTIQPAYGAIQVRCERQGEEVVGVSMTELRSLDVIVEEGTSCLVAVQNAGSVQLRLWLDPHIRVYMGTD
jgi:hypothetical protein